jgi:hypothetical protein
MKALTLLAAACLLSTSILAQENLRANAKFDSSKEYYFDFLNIKTKRDVVPAISFSFKPRCLKKLNCMIAYANNFMSKNKPFDNNGKIENIYVALSYRF